MQLNYFAILVATVLQFIFGAIWYGPVFGRLWGKIHGFDKLSKAIQQKMMSQMGPFYLLQFLVTALTTIVLSIFISVLPQNFNVYILACLLWIGFTLPAQISSVIFGGTDKKWILKKIMLQSGASLICIEIAAIVLTLL